MLKMGVSILYGVSSPPSPCPNSLCGRVWKARRAEALPMEAVSRRRPHAPRSCTEGSPQDRSCFSVTRSWAEWPGEGVLGGRDRSLALRGEAD